MASSITRQANSPLCLERWSCGSSGLAHAAWKQPPHLGHHPEAVPSRGDHVLQVLRHLHALPSSKIVSERHQHTQEPPRRRLPAHSLRVRRANLLQLLLLVLHPILIPDFRLLALQLPQVVIIGRSCLYLLYELSLVILRFI